jgi:hypothetical protein
MGQPLSGYLSYLLRLRYADNARDPVWLLSLESPDRALHVTFRGLDELVTFLRSQMSQVECQGGLAVPAGRPLSSEDQR